jgi:hypothetical protein
MSINYVCRNSSADVAIVACPEILHDRLGILTVGAATSVLRDPITGKRLTVEHRKHRVAEIEAKVIGQDADVPYVSVDSDEWKTYLRLRSMIFFKKHSLGNKPPVDCFGAKWEDMN